MKIVSIIEKYKNFFKILEATIEASNGDIIKRDIFSRGTRGNSENSVAAIVYDIDKDKYIFTKQHRVGLYKEDDMSLIEIVAGTLKEDEDINECMVREIEEELGYATDSIELINEFYVSPGGSSEKVYLYYVEVKDKISDGGGLISEHEEIEVIEMSLDEMYEFNPKDAKTIIGIDYIRNLLQFQ